MKLSSLLLSAALTTLGVSKSFGVIVSDGVLAYEQFDNPLLAGSLPYSEAYPVAGLLPSTGMGFSGTWQGTGKNVSSASHFSPNGGYQYPSSSNSSLIGTEANTGVFVAQGDDSGAAFFRLNFDAVTSAVTSDGSTRFYVSWLGARLGPEADGSFAGSNPFPTNAGARFPSQSGAQDNSQMGMIGTTGDDTPGYAMWGWKDTNGLQTGSDAALGEVNFFVVEFDPAISQVTAWVNPVADVSGGEMISSEGFASFTFTDGFFDDPSNPVPQDITLYGFGLEGGISDAVLGKPAGAYGVDEIIVGETFRDVAGMDLGGIIVIPEPSMFGALVGLMGIGFMVNRRRR